MKKLITICAVVGMFLAVSGTASASLSLSDGTISVGPVLSASPWWDNTNYKRVVSSGTIDAQTGLPVQVSGRLSNFAFAGGSESTMPVSAFFEVGLMTQDEYDEMQTYDSSSNPNAYASSAGRGSNRGIYLIVADTPSASEVYMEDWGGYWPPDGGNYPGQYYPTDDGQTVFTPPLGASSVLDFSFTMYPSGSYGGTVDATVTVTDGASTWNWSTTGLPYGRYNPAATDPGHTGDGSDWAIVEDFSQAHLFVNLLSYTEWSSSVSASYDYSGVQAIPEPATIALLGLGALSLLRRKRKA